MQTLPPLLTCKPSTNTQAMPLLIPPCKTCWNDGKQAMYLPATGVQG